MVAAYLAYQLIDLLLAAWLIAVVDRRVGGRGSLQRTVMRTLPLAGALLLLLALLFAAWLHVWIGAAAWALFGAKWSARFLGIGMAYWGGLLLLPALVVVRTWRLRAGVVARAGAVAWLAASLLLIAEMTFREPRRLVVETREVVLDEWPAGARPLRIALVADVQSPLLTGRERELVERLRSLAPDLVVVTGDLMAQSFDDAQARACARFVLAGCEAPLGTFVVNGDVDDLVEGGLAEALASTRATLLDNRSVVVETGSVALELVGCDPSDGGRYWGAISKAASSPKAAVQIAVVHQPFHVEELGPAGFDLVLAGHTHGGQIVLPGIGPLVTLSKLPDEIDAGGLHRIAGTQLCVSRGVGCEAGFAPPMRFHCPPELTLLTLRGARE
jgi:predicted MPP superfamily phosphohydrolase